MARRLLHSNAVFAGASIPALEFLTGTERGRLVQLDRSQATIGRTAENDIVLESEAVSRCHARLLVEGGAVRIADNRSKNGVLVNGERIRDRILADGDIVQLGNFLFRFHGDLRGEGVRMSDRPGPYAFGTPYTIPPMATTQPYAHPPGGHPGDPFDATRAAMQLAIAERRSPYFFYGMLLAVLVCGAVLIASRFAGPIVPSVVPPDTATNGAVEQAPKSVALAPEPERDVEPPTAREAPPVMPVPVAPQPEAPAPDVPTVEEVAAMDDRKAIEIYLNEGRDFLKRGDFANAAQAFQIALVIDPRNATAMKGIRAAEFQTKHLDAVVLESVPKVIRPRADKSEKAEKAKPEAKAEPPKPRVDARAEAQKKIDGLLRDARAALEQKRYSDAVRLGDEVLELDGKAYGRSGTEAKQLVERAKSAQREEFEPFVQQAKELIVAGRAQSGLELCEEMLRRDPNYGPARECAAQARRMLGGKK
jgi:tetratricopeptide (TPR) repeat protein